MKDISTCINELRRPKLLVRAALHGVGTYDRSKHLARYMSVEPVPGPGVALMKLFEFEREMNNARIAKTGTYVPSRHVDILVAIMAEAQLWRATHQPRLVFG